MGTRGGGGEVEGRWGGGGGEVGGRGAGGEGGREDLGVGGGYVFRRWEDAVGFLLVVLVKQELSD